MRFRTGEDDYSEQPDQEWWDRFDDEMRAFWDRLDDQLDQIWDAL